MVKTAIVILNWNGLDFLKKFLKGVSENSSVEGVKIYVADNGSTDDSVEWVNQNFSNIATIKLNENHGFAGGYNLALAQIEAEYYVLLNSDIEVIENWLTPLINFMDSNPDVAACQPKILSYKNRNQFEYAGAAGGYIDKFGYPFCRGRILHVTENDNGQYDSQAEIFWASGACMMVRSEAWKKCSGFDADFFAHMEEIDLCWRMGKAGYRICYIPESVVYHVGGGALPYNSPFKIYLNFRNSLFILYKNLPDKNFRAMLFFRKLLDGLAAGLFLAKGNTKAVRSIWRAHMDYYRSSDKLKLKRDLLKKSQTENFSLKIMNKSIVFEFYAKGRKTYSSLNR